MPGAAAGAGPAVAVVPLAGAGGWGKAVEVPGTAALNKGGAAGTGSVSCPAAGSCAAGGSYGDGSGHLQAFVVVAVYQRHHSVSMVMVVFEITEARARAILHARGVEMAAPPKPVAPAGPGPAGWVSQRQAARLPGTSTDAVRRAAANGQIRERRDEHGKPWYPRADIDTRRDQFGFNPPTPRRGDTARMQPGPYPAQ